MGHVVHSVIHCVVVSSCFCVCVSVCVCVCVCFVNNIENTFCIKCQTFRSNLRDVDHLV